MSLRYGYELGFALSCTSALLIVLLGGELPALAWAGVAIVWAAMAMRLQNRSAPGWLGTLIGLAGLIAGVTSILSRGIESLVLGSTIAIIGLLSGRVITRTELNHDLQALLLTLLMLFAGAALNTSISFGVTFIMYAVTSVWALLTRQLVDGAHREAERRGGSAVESTLVRRDVVTPTFFAASGLLSVVVLSGTLLLFLLFPRVGIGAFGVSFQNQRLPDNVSLSSPPRGRMSSSVVARVTGITNADYRVGLYFKASTYSRLTPFGFEKASSNVVPASLSRPSRATEARRQYDVFLQPVTRTRLPTLGFATNVKLLAGGGANPSRRRYGVGKRDSNGDIVLSEQLSGPVRYRIEGFISTANPRARLAQPVDMRFEAAGADRDSEDMLELPSALDPRVTALAAEIVGTLKTHADKADALRSYLSQQFTYTLSQPTAGSETPLSDFVLETKAGHCEHFATAFATMLRAVGVPARVAGGFHGGAWDASSDTVVFQLNHAHAWVEWYRPGFGWVTDDATPAFEGYSLGTIAEWLEWARKSWDERVVEFGLADQLNLAQQARQRFSTPKVGEKLSRDFIRKVATPIAAVVAVLLFAYLMRGRVSATRSDALVRAIERAIKSQTGSAPEPHVTFREILNGLTLENRRASDIHPVAPRRVIDRAVSVYEARRFGPQRRSPSQERELIRALNEL